MKEIFIPSIPGKDMTSDYLSFCLDQCEKGTLIDLGCGHGNHSIMARNKGFIVTAIDGRKDRIPWKEKNITWLQKNINDVDFSGFIYNTVLASGILYHLTLDEQMKLFEKIEASKVKNLIVNTHFAIFNETGSVINEKFKQYLSARVEIFGGYHYSIYDERENFRERPEAALNNQYSCWFDFESLIKVIENIAGFKDITILKPLLCEDRCWLICKR